MIEKFFPNRQFDAFLFDFDGTVADTMPVHFTAWNKALGLYHLSLTIEEHHGWAGRPTREIIRLLSELHKKELPVDEILLHKHKHYMSSLREVKAIVPVVEIISASYGKIPMAVVSGSRRPAIEAALEHLGMPHFFEFIVGAEDYVNGKPSPDCFLHAAKLLNVEPEGCLVFEDANLGIQAAKAAGMEYLRISVHGDGHQIHRERS